MHCFCQAKVNIYQKGLKKGRLTTLKESDRPYRGARDSASVALINVPHVISVNVLSKNFVGQP